MKDAKHPPSRAWVCVLDWAYLQKAVEIAFLGLWRGRRAVDGTAAGDVDPVGCACITRAMLCSPTTMGMRFYIS